MELGTISAEIQRVRRQIQHQRKEIQALQRAGIPTRSAKELLVRMHATVDGLCEERDRRPMSHRQTRIERAAEERRRTDASLPKGARASGGRNGRKGRISHHIAAAKLFEAQAANGSLFARCG